MNEFFSKISLIFLIIVLLMVVCQSSIISSVNYNNLVYSKESSLNTYNHAYTSHLEFLVGKEFTVYIIESQDLGKLAESINDFVWNGDGEVIVEESLFHSNEGFDIAIYNGDDVRAYVISVGYVKYIVKDGRSLPYLSYHYYDMNASLLRDLIRDIMEIDHFDLVYAGSEGDIKVVEIREWIYPNDTTKTGRKTVHYTNPYDKYYIVLDGVRIGYPIKIRGVDKIDVIGRLPIIQYLEMVLPKIKSSYKIKLDYSMVEEIALIYNRAFNDAAELRDLIIADIYYLFSKDGSRLLPTIKLYKEGTGNVVWIQLYEDRVELLSAATYAASNIGEDDHSINIEKLLSTPDISSNNPFTYNDILIYVIMSIPLLLGIGLVAYRLNHRR